MVGSQCTQGSDYIECVARTDVTIVHDIHHQSRPSPNVSVTNELFPMLFLSYLWVETWQSSWREQDHTEIIFIAQYEWWALWFIPLFKPILHFDDIISLPMKIRFVASLPWAISESDHNYLRPSVTIKSHQVCFELPLGRGLYCIIDDQWYCSF